MNRSGLLVGMFVVLVVVLLMSPHLVNAQTPEPTAPVPTSTPSHQQGLPLSTGNEMLLEKRVSYGDVAVVVAVLVGVTVQILTAAVVIPRVLVAKNER